MRRLGMCWLAALVALGGSGVQGADEAKDPTAPNEKQLRAFIHERVGAERVTGVGVRGQALPIDPSVSTLCRSPSPEEVPHPKEAYYHVYVNDLASGPIWDPSAKFPAGAVIVKEKLSRPKSGRPLVFTGMVKREPGYSPKDGDWEYFTLDGFGNRMNRGRLESCMSCHRKYANRDYVTKVYTCPPDAAGAKIEAPAIVQTSHGAAPGSFHLHASRATVHGKNLRYEPLPHKNTLGFWTNVDDSAEWRLAVAAPGTFAVEILQGCGKGSGGAEVDVTVGSERLTFTVQDTGRFQNFIRREIGRVRIPQSGPTVVSVKPRSKPGVAVMDLREIVLKPVAPPAAVEDADAAAKAGRYERAIQLYTQLLTERGADPTLRDQRGDARLFQGDYQGAVEDFDAYLKAVPASGPRHWRRGIALCLAGKYAEGMAQFEAYQTVDGADVENVAWWWLCAVHELGLEKASERMPNVGFDRRIPLMEIDKLYRGRATSKDVLDAIDAGSPAEEELQARRFYGRLYLGLYRLARDDRKQAIDDFEKAAVANYLPGYMGEVARGLLQDATAFKGTPPVEDRRRFRSEIEAFQLSDKASPAPRGGTVFVGSSTIRLWPLAESLSGVPAVNRGFGGSMAMDAALHAYELAASHAPAAVVYYEGDNDLAAGVSPASIASDVAKFVDDVRFSHFPGRKRIILLGVKPSVRRWRLLERQRETNALLARLADGDAVQFLDLGPLLLGLDGRPRAELYQADGLHLSKAGYKLWSDRLLPLLK